MTNATNKRIRKPVITSAPPSAIRMSSVPDESVYSDYVGRVIDGKAEFEIFDYAYENDINVLIEGPTGPGKTMAMRAYCARPGKKKHFYSIPSNVGAEPSQLLGKYIPNEDRKVETDPAFVWVDGPVTDIARHGGVLLWNEVNFLPPRIKTVVFALLDGRREITLLDHKGEVIRLHRYHNCWCGQDPCNLAVLIAADMNPGYVGTQVLNAAFRNRFGIQLDWQYDPTVEIKLVASATLRTLAGNIRKMVADGTVNTPVSTNMLMEFERMAADLGVGFAINNFINHFSTEDRESIRTAMEGAADNLRSDFKPKAASVATAPEDEYEYEGGSANLNMSDIVSDSDYEWANS